MHNTGAHEEIPFFCPNVNTNFFSNVFSKKKTNKHLISEIRHNNKKVYLKTNPDGQCGSSFTIFYFLSLQKVLLPPFYLFFVITIKMNLKHVRSVFQAQCAAI